MEFFLCLECFLALLACSVSGTFLLKVLCKFKDRHVFFFLGARIESFRLRLPWATWGCLWFLWFFGLWLWAIIGCLQQKCSIFINITFRSNPCFFNFTTVSLRHLLQQVLKVMLFHRLKLIFVFILTFWALRLKSFFLSFICNLSLALHTCDLLASCTFLQIQWNLLTTEAAEKWLKHF